MLIACLLSLRSCRHLWKGRQTRRKSFAMGKDRPVNDLVPANPLRRPAKTGLQGYLASLNRVEYKLSQLRSTNLRVNQEAVSELDQLINYGKKRLLEPYESVIQEDVRAIEPLHYITKGRALPFTVAFDALTKRQIYRFLPYLRVRYQSLEPSLQPYLRIRPTMHHTLGKHLQQFEYMPMFVALI